MDRNRDNNKNGYGGGRDDSRGRPSRGPDYISEPSRGRDDYRGGLSRGRDDSRGRPSRDRYECRGRDDSRGGQSRDRDRSNHDSSIERSRGRFEGRGRGRGGNGRGRGGRGRGRGGGRVAKPERPEFYNQPTTIPDHPGFEKSDMRDAVKKVQLCTNFFQIEKMPKFDVKQYSIDFIPNPRSDGIKRVLIEQQRDIFGACVYDNGSLIYMFNSLSGPEIRLNATCKGTKYEIIVRERSQIHATDGNFLTILNLVVRDAMRLMNFTRVGRDFYDNDPDPRVRVSTIYFFAW